MSDFCLTLLCSPATEERLLDFLLMAPGAAVLVSAPVAAHGLAFGTLSQTEQVLGRAHATQIRLICAAENKDGLLEEIRRKFSGAGVRYWTTPIAEAGELS